MWYNIMWYDTDKLKDVNEIKIIIAKRTRKGRNTMEKELSIKDLFIKSGCFCVAVVIDKDYHLFIEGLSDNGEAITSGFDISLVKNVIVEIIRTGVEVIDTLEAKLSTKLTVLLEQVKTIEKERKKQNEKL